MIPPPSPYGNRITPPQQPPTPSNHKAIDSLLFNEENFSMNLSARGKKVQK
jgi:hypothetical protein